MSGDHVFILYAWIRLLLPYYHETIHGYYAHDQNLSFYFLLSFIFSSFRRKQPKVYSFSGNMSFRALLLLTATLSSHVDPYQSYISDLRLLCTYVRVLDYLCQGRCILWRVLQASIQYQQFSLSLGSHGWVHYLGQLLRSWLFIWSDKWCISSPTKHCSLQHLTHDSRSADWGHAQFQWEAISVFFSCQAWPHMV